MIGRIEAGVGNAQHTGQLPCAGKLAYEEPQTAHDVARRAKQRSKRKGYRGSYGGNCAAYRCPCCGKWHVGRFGKTQFKGKPDAKR